MGASTEQSRAEQRHRPAGRSRRRKGWRKEGLTFGMFISQKTAGPKGPLEGVFGLEQIIRQPEEAEHTHTHTWAHSYLFGGHAPWGAHAHDTGASFSESTCPVLCPSGSPQPCITSRLLAFGPRSPVPEENRSVSAGMGTSDGGEAGPGAPQPNRIEVHVHQESGLAKLLLSGCSLLQPLVLQPRTASQTLGSSRLLVASWVVQIVLGVLSGVLGGFLYISRSTTLRESGAPIWTGAVAVLAGVVAFVYEKRGGIYWALLRTALALTAFSTATAAIVIAAANFNQYHYSFYDNICDVSPPWGPTWPPGTPNPDVSRQQLCILYLDKLKAMFTGLQVILLGVWVLLLLASLVPLCLCCWRRYQQKEKGDLLLEDTAASGEI
uniref:Transmembrane protein 176A n=1 Tax=Sus scrofa TaxID=9823 RepID=A0A8D1MT40_PIG